MSSAHVYLRLHKGQNIDDISEGVLEDCAQLVKANSIQGKNSTLPLYSVPVILLLPSLENWSFVTCLFAVGWLRGRQ